MGILMPSRKMKSLQAVRFLEMFYLCQELHVLPQAGGLLDQDSLFVHLMLSAFRWQQERRQLDEHNQRANMPKSPRGR